MNEWIAWLTQHPLARGAVAISVVWFILGCWRWWRCRQQLAYLDLPLLLPMLLGFACPLLILRGLSAGWERFDLELSRLATLEPWEGLRALEIVRHACQTFFTWSTPLVTAGIACFMCAIVVTMVHSVWRFDLYLHARRHRPNEIQQIRLELTRLRELLEAMQSRQPVVP